MGWRPQSELSQSHRHPQCSRDCPLPPNVTSENNPCCILRLESHPQSFLGEPLFLLGPYGVTPSSQPLSQCEATFYTRGRRPSQCLQLEAPPPFLSFTPPLKPVALLDDIGVWSTSWGVSHAGSGEGRLFTAMADHLYLPHSCLGVLLYFITLLFFFPFIKPS